jgi:hypothetical protein
MARRERAGQRATVGEKARRFLEGGMFGLVSPHWGPPDLLAWVHYGRLWSNLMTWLAG